MVERSLIPGRFRVRRRAAAAVSVLIALGAPAVTAQAPPSPPPPGLVEASPPPPVPPAAEKILRVEIRGLRHQTEARVKALLESREGRLYDREVLSEDVHRLVRKGWFAHVEHKVDPLPGGVALVFTVVENDRVAVTELSGVRALDANALRGALRIKAGEYYDPFKVKLDLDALREAYQEKGYHFVSVTAPPPAAGPDGLTVPYVVVEGPRVAADAVRFTGVREADEGVLLDQIRMRPPRWPMSWVSSEPFIEREARLDVERLKAYYRLEGWLDVDVTLVGLEFSPDKSAVTIVYHVVEGAAYRVKKLGVQGNALFTADELLQAIAEEPKDTIPLRPGGPFSERALNEATQIVLNKYRERAYILAQVDVQRVYAREKPEVDLVFAIREQGQIYLDGIEIRGNTKTRDDVIRRALRVAPGEEYNKVALDRGIRRLKDLGYFERITYREEPASAPDRRTLVVEVVEAPTGSIRLAGGYSSSAGIVGLIRLTQNNFDLGNPPASLLDFWTGEAFAGGGQTFQLDFMPGTERTSAVASFYEPYVFGEPIGFSARAYRTRIHRTFGYLEDRLGGQFGLNRRFLDEHVKLGLGMRVENIDIRDIDADAPPDVFEVAGLNQIRSAIPSLQVDWRDSVIRPTEGGSASLTVELAGGFLGGDFSYSKWRLEADYHIPLFTTQRKFRHVLSFGATVGWIGLKDPTENAPIFERFFLGGGGVFGLRGFAYKEAGPKYGDDPVGGRGRGRGHIAYGFPLYEDIIRGATFLDMGDLEPSFRELTVDRMRYSTGVGIRFTIPQLGVQVPLNLYYCIPLRKMPGDERNSIYFDMGFPF
jgi:outer membrane protein insertion porin family